MINWFKNNILIISLFIFCIVIFAITARINLFRYNNFDFGKFDLGNMTQMVWYTLHGKPLYLTDYFGTNLPRWAMSHVDPILLVFVPTFALYQHPLNLVFSQIILVMSGGFLVYKIAELKLKSKFAGFLLALAYFFYPAIGFLNAWTGFHGVTAVIPFFLGAFYVFELMDRDQDFSVRKMILFWLLLVLTMMGKEQLPLYVFLFGFYIAVFRFHKSPGYPSKAKLIEWIKGLLVYKNVQIGLSMMLVGFLWFYMAFFVIIPAYAHYRIDGFQRFAQSMELNTDVARDVQNSNYFLSRYEAFGSSYSEVLIGMVTQPKELVRVLFGGERTENLDKTLKPLAYTSLLYPPVFIIAFPDFLINYGTTQGGIGTSEIINHRISMIIPVLFLATIYGIYNIAGLIKRFIDPKKTILGLAGVVLVFSIYTSFAYENPVYLWLSQAVQKRVQVFAKEDKDIGLKEDIQVGERFTLSALDNKDRECALKVVNTIPDRASISGPDYLGAHLSMRETYAIFPALNTEADYVIVDVFSQKIVRILDLNVDIVRDVVADMIKNPDYRLKLGCGNLFVFEKVGPHDKPLLLPLQETFTYSEEANLEIFESLTVVDYDFPETITRGEVTDAQLVYVKREESKLDDYVLFLSFINDTTGEIYQVANLPSFALNQLRNWAEDRYYIEDLQLAVPEFLDAGNYRIFIGMTNSIRTRSIYLGDIEVN